MPQFTAFRSLIQVMVIASAVLWPMAAMAVMPDEVLSDPGLEARARDLSRQLRCLVCQNQSIDDSAAPLARDLRIIVRERLMKGDTDREVLGYLVARYGNFVLLNPPLQSDTLLLWLGPGLIVSLSGLVFLLYLRRGGGEGNSAIPLTEDERRQIESITGELTT